MRRLALALATAALLAPLASRADLPPIVPRTALFGDPEQAGPSVSPDGHWLAWKKRNARGQLDLWVRGLDRDTVWKVTSDHAFGPAPGVWSSDSRWILYLDDQGGDENNHLYGVDVRSGVTREMTPFPGVRVEGVHLDVRHPGVALLGLNVRDPRVFDLYRVDLATGDTTLEARNPGDVIEWAMDDDFRVRACVALRAADAATTLRVRHESDGAWHDLVTWSMEEAGSDRSRKILGFADPHTLLVQMWAGGNTSRIVRMDANDGHVIETLAQDPHCDLWGVYDGTGDQPMVLLSPDHHRLLAVAFLDQKAKWKALDPSVQPDLDALGRLAGRGEFVVDGTDAAGRRWVVQLLDDHSRGRWVIWDHAARRATPLFDADPQGSHWTFADMTPITIRARDGLEIPCYLTLPPGVPARHLPIVINPHGGPWFRDVWGWNPEVQWLANRGYAVLQVNFRSSTGFGRSFMNAGDRQFGPGQVQGDLIDALHAMVARGIADSTRVGIMGWSFGGYSTLAALAFHPELFACGVDGVGPGNLRTLFQSFPPYWAARLQRWVTRMGDVLHDDALNEKLSPLYHVDAMRAPLLIGHGENDPRVKIAESETIVKALRARGTDVTFIVYPDEGHGFGRPQNNEDFYGRAEEFLAKHLGGRAEAWHAVEGSTAQVR